MNPNNPSEQDVRVARVIIRMHNALIGGIYATGAAILATQIDPFKPYIPFIMGCLLARAILAWVGR